MADIPTTEPTSFTAGDTVKWTRSLDDYSAADGWVLSYAIRNATLKIDVTASASGSDHAVVISAATSAAYAPGTYAWAAFITKAAERYEVARGSLIIRANLAMASAFDGRTQAAKAVEDLKAALAVFKTSQGRIRRYRIGDREMEFETIADMLTLLRRWEAELASEQAVERLAAGLASPSRLQVRM